MAMRSSKGTVLLVEDNDDNRAIYSTGLTRDGYRVEEVTSGDEALRVAPTLRPDIIVLDISLPGLDGWTVAERLKGDPRTRETLIIAVTAHALPEDYRRAAEVGCDGYLAKPVRPRRVLEEVNRLIAQRKEAGAPAPDPGKAHQGPGRRPDPNPPAE